MTVAQRTGGAARTPGRIHPAGFFVLRTPLLPFDDLLRWAEGVAAPLRQGDPDELDAAVRADTELLRSRLAALAERPEVQEALFLASADFAEAHHRSRQSGLAHSNLRLEPSTVRYLSRMSSRATPFALCAGCSVGTIESTSRLEVGPLSTGRRHARLDVDFLTELSETLARDPDLRASLRYRPNPTLYELAGRLRYAQARTANGVRSYELVAVVATPHLRHVLDVAHDGARTSELSASLVTDDVTADDATAYVNDLIDANVLVAEFGTMVTGDEPQSEFVAQCRRLPLAPEVLSALEDVDRRLVAMDAVPLGVGQESYRQLQARLAGLPIAAQVSRLFRVELVKSGSPTIGTNVVDEIISSVELMDGLHQWAGPFADFRQRFESRYERQEVPLLEVLDEDTGIPFDTIDELGVESLPLIRGLGLAVATADENAAAPWSALNAFLLERLLECIARGERILRLSAAELQRVKPARRHPLPASFCAHVTIAAASGEALNRGEFEVVFNSAVGPTGGALLGRFCHADPLLTKRLKAYLREEAATQPAAVFAEIVHLPDGRAGNIVVRPLLREYEIPILSRSGAPPARQIPLSDLWISVRDDRVILRSGQLGVEVQPKLSTAHNFGFNSLHLYRFMCLLQFQNTMGTRTWSWGPLEDAPFLPRVVVGRVVLSRARWRVRREEWAAATDGPAAFSQLAAWRKQRQLQRFACLIEPMKERLLFDFDNVLSVQTLVDHVRRKDVFTLEEFYPGPEQLCCAGPDGRFTHELIVPLTTTVDAPTAAPATHRASSAQRHQLPGSNWLYAKLYTGVATSDLVLREVVRPLLEESGQAINQWFFVRYNDPRWHLRIRFNGNPAFLAERLLPRLSQLFEPLLASGAAAGFQLDTYQREIERYGGYEAMLIAERFFHINSDAALESIKAYHPEPTMRWLMALMGMDRMLSDLGLHLEDRLRFARAMRAGHLRDRGLDNARFRQKLGARFRDERVAVESIFTGAGDKGQLPSPADDILRRHSERFRAAVAEPLHTLWATGAASQNRSSIASTYLHMHVNRFARSAGLQHELVLYDFLARLYESKLARSGRTVPHE